jgi:hypothetical protein
MSRYDGSSILNSPPTYDGVPVSGGGGGGSVPDDIDINSVCAVTGTFQTLGVGNCGSPVYEFPTTAKDPGQSKGIIVSQGGKVTLVDITSNRFSISYGIGLDSFVRTLILTAQEYELQNLLSILSSQLNAQIISDGGNNTVSLTLGGDGKINFSINAGNVRDFLITNVSGWLLLGNTDNTLFPTPALRVFTNPPTYSDTTSNTSWSTYRFDDNGNVYSGDMTITGSLSVNTIISDIEVEDAIITLNKNGIADNNTSGVVLNSASNTQFSGLLKKDNSDDFYLFSKSSTLPTEVGWEAEQTGNLYLNQISVNTDTSPGVLSVESSGASEFPLYVKGAVGQSADLVRVVNDTGSSVMSVAPDGKITSIGGLVTIGQVDTLTGIQTGVSGSTYKLPNVRGTLGQVMTTDGVGNVTFQDPAVATGIQSPDTLTKITAVNGQLTADVAGDEILNAVDGTTVIKANGLFNPTITLRNNILSSNIATSGRNVFVFGPSQTNMLFDNDTVISLSAGDQVRRIGGLIREQLNSGSHVLSDASTVPRIEYDNTETRIGAPTATSDLSITDTSLINQLGGQNRLVIDGTGTTLIDPTGQERLKDEATLTTLTNATGTTFLELGDTTSRLSYGGVDALSLTSVVTTIRGGPAGFSELQLGGQVFGFDYRFGGQQRIKISAVSSKISSPDGQGEFDIRNDRALTVVNGVTRQELSASTTTIRDENNIDRIVADSGSTRLNAPTGSNKLTVSSSAVQADGAFVVQTTDPAQVQIRSNAPVGQVASLQQWQINFVTVAQIDQQGNGAFNNMFLANSNPSGSVISNLSSVPMTIGPSTHSKLNIGYAGAATTINGAVDVPNGLTIGAAPNKYAFPLVAGAEGQHLEVNASGDLVYTYGQIFSSVQANATTAMALPLQNTYYPLPNATTSLQSGGFTFGALGLVT